MHRDVALEHESLLLHKQTEQTATTPVGARATVVPCPNSDGATDTQRAKPRPKQARAGEATENSDSRTKPRARGSTVC